VSTFIVRIEYSDDYTGLELEPTHVAEAVTDKARRLSHAGGITVNVKPEPVVKATETVVDRETGEEIPLGVGAFACNCSMRGQNVGWMNHDRECPVRIEAETVPLEQRARARREVFACNPHEVLEQEMAEARACICEVGRGNRTQGEHPYRLNKNVECPVHGKAVD